MIRALAFAWAAALRPWRAFPARAAETPSLGVALGRMLLLRTPPTYFSGLLGFSAFAGVWRQIQVWEGPIPKALEPHLGPGLHAGDLQATALLLPLPGLDTMALALLAAAPLAVLSLWLHDAVWDHGCLWLLGARPSRAGFRASAIADAEALASGSLGVAAGLLGLAPGLGLALALPLLAVDGWFWVQRGFALAAWHRCPVWKGVTATLLHAVLAFGCALLTLGLAVLVAAQAGQ